MDAPGEDQRDDSIGELFGRLVEDGRAYAEAEVALYRQIAAHRAGRARGGLIALAAGAVLLLCALTALTLGAVLGLAILIGPLLAGLAVAAALALIGYGLIRVGIAGLGALKGSEDEAEALKRGDAQ